MLVVAWRWQRVALQVVIEASFAVTGDGYSSTAAHDCATTVLASFCDVLYGARRSSK